MAVIPKSFNEVKKDLRQFFFESGWQVEVEGETLPYYRIYTAMLDFIDDQFYGGIIPKEETKPKVIVHIESKCPKCGSGWNTFRKTTNEYRCRKCKNIWKLEKRGEKILPPPKPKPNLGYYFQCKNCGKKRALYRAKTKDYRCRECRHTWKK